MNERTNRTVICSIAFLDIVDYSKRVGQEQVVLKEAFNTLIAEVVKDIAPNDRVLIDTGDGAALCFMGDPENALFVVMNLRDRLRTPDNEVIGLTVRIGINLGPVRLIHDINDRQNVIGDGINVAQRVMSFAEPNQIMVSRSYYEIVSRLSQEYTRLFHYAGARTDKHVREHEVYEVGGGQDEPASVAVAPAAAPPPVAPPPAAVSTSETPRTEAAPAVATTTPSTAAAPTRNKWLVPGAIAAVVAVLAVGMFLGSILKPQRPAETAKAEAPAVKAADPAPSQTVLSPPATKPEPEASVSPPVAASVSGAKADGEAVSPPVAGSAPGTKADADAKAAAAKAKAPEPDPEKAAAAKAKALEMDAAKAATAKAKASELDAAKIAAAKAKAPEVDPAKAQPPVPVDPRKNEVAAAKKNEPRKDDAAKMDAKPSGTLEFWVTPWGDVFIDGARVGTSPPLKVYKLPAGSHRIEIYNDSAGFPFKTTVEVKADQVLRVNQAFRDR